MSTPQQFGSGARPLLGHWHEPDRAVRDVAVLICPSFGMEYMRAYRGVRLLAAQLAESGFPTLRFDYSCTGDSAGDAGEARVEHWLEDIATAAREMRDMAAITRVVLVGQRLGALLAAAAVARGAVRPDLLLLWDAPAQGAAYLEELKQLDSWLDTYTNRPRAGNAQLPPSRGDELLGHLWPQSLAEAIRALPGAEVPSTATLRACSFDEPVPAGRAAESVLRLPDPAHWRDGARLYSPLIARASVEQIVEALRQRFA